LAAVVRERHDADLEEVGLMSLGSRVAKAASRQSLRETPSGVA